MHKNRSSMSRVRHIMSHLKANNCDGHNDGILLNKLLAIIEQTIIPETSIGVSHGNKIFGGAILDNNANLIICGVNAEMECPLYHGEISTIKNFYDHKLHLKLQSDDLSKYIFLSTHEPCSMCLSAITWTGFTKIYYFFPYEMTTNSFNIPHDVNILRQVFGKTDANNYYNKSNEYFKAYNIIEMIGNLQNSQQRKQLMERVDSIKIAYAKLSQQYQQSKAMNNIPLN